MARAGRRACRGCGSTQKPTPRQRQTAGTSCFFSLLTEALRTLPLGLEPVSLSRAIFQARPPEWLRSASLGPRDPR